MSFIKLKLGKGSRLFQESSISHFLVRLMCSSVLESKRLDVRPTFFKER